MKILFYLPAVLFLVSGFPQMIKLLRTKSSEDISVWMYLLTCLGIGIVVTDAYLSGNNSIFVSNLASLAITGTNAFLIIRYRKRASLKLNSKETV
jgi:MtN3 and saliva related transmembrane protein